MERLQQRLSEQRAAREAEQRALEATEEYQRMLALVAAEDWDTLCPDNCTCSCTTGVVCALAGKGDRRCRRYMAQRRAALDQFVVRCGFPPRYQSASWDRVPQGDWSEALRDYARNIGRHTAEGTGLLLLGGVGVGKSNILCLLARALGSVSIGTEPQHADTAYRDPEDLQIWASARYVFVPRLIDSIYNDAFHRDNDGAYAGHRNTQLLLVDDIDRAVEYTANEGGSKPLARLDAFFEERYADHLATVIVGNITAAELSQVHELQRSVDRWRECMVAVEINASSQRVALQQ